jgi:hypothetical protein
MRKILKKINCYLNNDHEFYSEIAIYSIENKNKTLFDYIYKFYGGCKN